MFRFSKMGIRSRVYGGAALLVFLSVGLAIFAILQAMSTDRLLTRLGLQSDSTLRVLGVREYLEATRRTMNRYKFHSTEAVVNEHNEFFAKANGLLAEAAATTISEERRRLYENAKDGLVTYRGLFDRLVGLTNDVLLDRGNLFSGGDDLSAKTNKLVETARAERDAGVATLASDAETSVMLARVTAWRFLATLDPKGRATFKANADKATANLARLETAPGLSESVRSTVVLAKAALSKYAAIFETLSGEMLKVDQLFENDLREAIMKTMSIMDSAATSLKVNYKADQAAMKEVSEKSILTEAIVGVVALIGGAIIAYLLGRGLIRPISGMTEAMSKLAAGDMQVVVPSRDATDEMGAMAKTVDVFKVNGLEKIRLEKEQKELETFTAAQRKRDMIKLADDFESAVGEIINTVSSASTELEASATSLTNTAERSQKIAVVVAAASEEASANVQSVAAATEEMSSTVNEISRQVQESSRIANDAVEQANATNARVNALSEAASRIGDVVELITVIAGQTNLLALNATIEAARAGEAGRGFAVVASEVKALAEQTAKATGEISQQITGIQNATGFSVTAIKEIGTTIGKMSEIAAAIAAAVEEQGAATQEIARNVQQAALGTQEVSSNIIDVQRGTSETGSASSQVLSAAQLLSQDSNKLKVEVGRFLNTIRAA